MMLIIDHQIKVTGKMIYSSTQYKTYLM